MSEKEDWRQEVTLEIREVAMDYAEDGCGSLRRSMSAFYLCPSGNQRGDEMQNWMGAGRIKIPRKTYSAYVCICLGASVAIKG